MTYHEWLCNVDFSREQSPSLWNGDAIKMNMKEFCSEFNLFDNQPENVTVRRISARCFYADYIAIRMHDWNVVGISEPILRLGAPKRWTFSGEDKPPYYDFDIYIDAINPKKSRVTDVEKTQKHKDFIASLTCTK